ncbi:restriction endonuclease subunit S [Lactobacillus delbrueckii subsp. bulgaricus]|nr:hypothetical protein [Lactobacillus delbrueckii subsp. bulgaricus]
MKDEKKAPKLRFKGFTDDWEQCKLGDVGTFKGGFGFPENEQGNDSGIPFYKVSDMNDRYNALMMKRASNYVSDSQIDINNWKPILGQNIIFAKVGAAVYLERKRKVVGPFLLDNNMMSFQPKNADIDYIYYIFQRLHISKHAQVGTLPSLNAGELRNIEINIPSLAEQRVVANIGVKIDQTITLHEEKKRQLERLKSALLQKMFADKSGYLAVRFNGFCDEWKKQKLGDIVETITDYVAAGSFASLRENVIYRSEPCYAQLIRTADLKSNFSKIAPVYVDKQAFDFLYRVSLDKESVILPNIGNCGEVYYVDPHELPYMRNVLGPNAILIRSSSLNNHFLSILFQSHNFQKSLKLIISPNGQTKFNKTELKRIKMVLSMDVNEQNSLSAFFKMINTAISLQEHKSNILKELKSSLLQNMFI